MRYSSYLLPIALVIIILLILFSVITGRALDHGLPVVETFAQGNGTGDFVTTIAWNPDGTLIATGRANGIVHIWNASTGSAVHTLAGHQNRVSDLAWNPTGDKLLSAGHDGNVVLWDANTGQLLRQFEHNRRLVTAVTWRRDGKQILSAGGSNEGQTLFVWDADTGQLIREYGRGIIARMAWSPDGNSLAIVQGFGSVDFADPMTFDLLIGNLLQPEGLGKQFDIYAMAWSPDSQYIATGSLNGVVRIWDVATRQIIREMRGNDATDVDIEVSAISTVAFSVDGSKLFNMSNDGSLRVFETSSGQILATVNIKQPAVAYDVAWSPYAAQLAFGGPLVNSPPVLPVHDFGNGLLQVVAPFASVEELQTIVTQCVREPGVKQPLIGQLARRELPAFVQSVRALQPAQAPPACAADLIAVAGALQAAK